MKVLVSGSRFYSRKATIQAWLDGLYDRYGNDLVVIQGGAKGADTVAKEWADEKFGKKSPNNITERADWDAHGNAAGAIRNQKMIDDHKPDLILCFKDTFDWEKFRGGTEDMAQRGLKNGIPTFVVQKVIDYEKF